MSLTCFSQLAVDCLAFLAYRLTRCAVKLFVQVRGLGVAFHLTSIIRFTCGGRERTARRTEICCKKSALTKMDSISTERFNIKVNVNSPIEWIWFVKYKHCEFVNPTKAQFSRICRALGERGRELSYKERWDVRDIGSWKCGNAVTTRPLIVVCFRNVHSAAVIISTEEKIVSKNNKMLNYVDAERGKATNS